MHAASRRQRRARRSSPTPTPDAVLGDRGRHGPHRRHHRGDAAAAAGRDVAASLSTPSARRDLDDCMARMLERRRRRTATRSRGSTASRRGAALGRSVLTRGNHAAARRACRRRQRARARQFDAAHAARARRRGCRTARSTALTIRAFNELWFRKAPRAAARPHRASCRSSSPARRRARLEPHLRPRGFVQYQFVVPYGAERRRAHDARAAERGPHPVVPRGAQAVRARQPGLAARFPMRGLDARARHPRVGAPGSAPLLDGLDELVVGPAAACTSPRTPRLRPELARGDVPASSTSGASARAALDPRRRAAQRHGPPPRPHRRRKETHR